MEFGLIGYPLKHSFSKEIHSMLTNYTYDLCELDDSFFDTFMKRKDFKGINVTIPYKQKVIPYLDYIDDTAKTIHAVNTIINDNGKLKGYNTDILGVIATLKYFNIDPIHKKVLILGTGATSNTVFHALQFMKINNSVETLNQSFTKNSYDVDSTDIIKAYRPSSKIQGDILYDDIHKVYDDINIIINTTSNGMYPHTEDSLLIDLHKFTKLEAVMDVIYNPLRTKLLIEAEKAKAKSISGLYMLIAQAVFASKIFTENATISSSILSSQNLDANSPLINYEQAITSIYKKYLKEKQNIVLIGMPTCGKTTIGKKLANKLGYNFIDTDVLIKNEINMTIKEFIQSNGEEKFREIETEIIKKISTCNKTVVATGGGSILREENVTNLKLNGIIYFLNRSIALLHPTPDRPLTGNYNDLKKKYYERLPIYKRSCDIVINADLDNKEIIDAIINSFSREK